MANKIVLIPDGSDTGEEFPLDVDTGTDGKGILWSGGNLFWVTIGLNVKLYSIDRAKSQAIFQDISFAWGGAVAAEGITWDNQQFLYPFGQIAQGPTRNTWGWRIRTTSNRVALTIDDILVNSFGGVLPAGFKIRDTTFDGQKLWFQRSSGGISTTFDLHDAQRRDPGNTVVPAFGGDSGNDVARGLSVIRSNHDPIRVEQEAFWWSDADGGKRLYKVMPPFTMITDPIIITNAGTMRCMDDCGPYVAMMFN